MTRLEIVLPQHLVGPRVLVNGAVHDRFLRGRLSIDDLSPGPHTIAVGADGCEGQIHVVVLHRNETRRLEIALRPRERIATGGGR